jgi:hypothetical protein
MGNYCRTVNTELDIPKNTEHTSLNPRILQIVLVLGIMLNVSLNFGQHTRCALIFILFTLSVPLSLAAEQAPVSECDAILRKDSAPLAEELWGWQRESPAMAVTPDSSASWFRYFKEPHRLLDNLKIIRSVPEKSNFIFVGNGSYVTYLALKGLLRHTRFEKQIFFIPASRKLFENGHAPEDALTPLFRILDIKNKPGNWVVFDTLMAVEAPNDHCLLYVTQALRQFLYRNGVPLKEIQNRVIALGMAEGGRFEHSYQTRSLMEYRRRLDSLTAAHLSTKTPSIVMPYFSSAELKWDLVTYQYGYGMSASSDSYWAGKYVELDRNGFPVGSTLLSTLGERQQQEQLSERRRKAVLYLDLLHYTETMARSEPQIRQFIEDLESDSRY